MKSLFLLKNIFKKILEPGKWAGQGCQKKRGLLGLLTRRVKVAVSPKGKICYVFFSFTFSYCRIYFTIGIRTHQYFISL